MSGWCEVTLEELVAALRAERDRLPDLEQAALSAGERAAKANRIKTVRKNHSFALVMPPTAFVPKLHRASRSLDARSAVRVVTDAMHKGFETER